jgi:hypothetical protein
MHRTKSIVLSVLLLIVFSMNTASVSCGVNVIPYINYTQGFSIHAPGGWSWDENSDFVKKTPGAVVAFIGPILEFVRPNILIGAEAVLSTVSIEEYFSRTKDALRLVYPDFFILDEDRRVVNGLACYELTGEHRSYFGLPLTGSGGGATIMQNCIELVVSWE